MLNLFTLKENHSKLTKKYNLAQPEHGLSKNKTSKHFPSPSREWKNSVYFYNKNSLNLIPSSSLTINNTIKSYFNLYNKHLEVLMRTKRLLLRLRRLSSNKFYISSGEFKHTNNKVLINLYVFNRQKNNYLLTLKKWYLNTFLTNTAVKQRNINIKLIRRLKLINKKGIQAVKTINRDRYLLIKAIDAVSKDNNYNINNFKDLSEYTNNFYKNLIKKSLKKIRMYFYYRQLMFINRSKLNYTYLQFLKNKLEKICNKNVEFNIINIKRFYLNSDIMSESITIKLSRNRRKMIKYLNNLKNKISVKKKSFVTKISNYNVKRDFTQYKSLMHNFIIESLKYKHVTGFRLEAKGRLSKRFTASRSMNKLKYKGNLLDLDSSYKGLSSVLLKGNLKSNTQYTKLRSKTRTGSFGIKGWISGN